MYSRFATVILAVLALSVSACSFDGEGESSQTGPQAGQSVDSRLYSALPLQRYDIWLGERLQRVRLAEDELVARCMRQEGVQWNPPPISDADADPEFRRYGVMHADVARTYGFHPPIDPIAERRNAYFLEELTDRQRKAFLGSDREGGCEEEARQQLYRGVGEVDPTFVGTLGQRSLDESGKTSPVRRVKAEWSSCMEAKSFRYADPFDALEDPAWDWEKALPSKREISVAMADVACKQETGLVEVWVEAEAEVQRDLIAEHAKELETIDQANKTLLANAERELRNAG